MPQFQFGDGGIWLYWAELLEFGFGGKMLRFFLFILLSTSIFAQETRVTREWGTYWGIGNNEAHYELEYKDSLLYITSVIEGPNPPFDDNFSNSNFVLRDFSLFIYDQFKNEISGFYAGGSQNEGFSSSRFVNNSYYISMNTPSNDIILQNEFDNTFELSEGYIAKYDSDFNLVWGSYNGGEGAENQMGLIVDNDENVYSFGVTPSRTFTIKNAYQENFQGSINNAFVTKVDKNGNLEWSTYLGTNREWFNTADLDEEGNIYLGGVGSGNNAGINSFQNSPTASSDLYLAKFNPSGVLVWATYFGGNSQEQINDLAYNDGHIYVCGRTQSSNQFTFGNKYDNSYDGNVDGFVAKFDTTGFPVWSTYIGGSEKDEATGIDIDESGNIYIVGHTNSDISFATENAYLDEYQGNIRNLAQNYGDVFFAKFDSEGNNEFISYYGGEDEDWSPNRTIEIDDTGGFLYFGGRTISSTNIAQNGFDNQLGSGVRDNSFLAKMKLEYLISSTQLTGGSISVSDSGYIQHGQPLEIEFTPDRGYFLKNIIYNGDTLSADAKLEIEAVRNPVNVSAIWKIDPLGDIDGDGIPNQVELDAPNDGDANGDSTLDIFQLNVASVQDSVSERYITIQSSEKQIVDIAVTYEENDNYIYPYGLNEFKLSASSDSVKIIYHDISDLSGFQYRKLTSENKYISYQDYKLEQIKIDGKSVAQVTLYLQDGGIGDYDGEVNGVIYDPGGPAFPDPSDQIPIWDWWHLIVLGIIGFGYFLLKKN
jgi:hypothetical protein